MQLVQSVMATLDAQPKRQKMYAVGLTMEHIEVGCVALCGSKLAAMDV